MIGMRSIGEITFRHWRNCLWTSVGPCFFSADNLVSGALLAKAFVTFHWTKRSCFSFRRHPSPRHFIRTVRKASEICIFRFDFRNYSVAERQNTRAQTIESRSRGKKCENETLRCFVRIRRFRSSFSPSLAKWKILLFRVASGRDTHMGRRESTRQLKVDGLIIDLRGTSRWVPRFSLSSSAKDFSRAASDATKRTNMKRLWLQSDETINIA